MSLHGLFNLGVNKFKLALDRNWKSSRRFGFSPRSLRLGHVMFWFWVNAQEAGSGGRSGAVGILARGSLMGRFS